MTKAIPPNRLLIKKRDGNQEDIHVLDPVKRLFKLQQQQSPDRDEKTEKLQSTCNRTRDARRPTLEELLDLELDLVLPATGMSAPANNQLPVCVAREEDVDSVSLELLAMQSPHGENQQWQQGEEEEEHDSTPPEHSPRNKMDEPLAPRKSMPLNISSPTAFSSSFPFSPTHSAADDDYGLASPMALPDSPSQGKSAIALALDLELAFPRLEDGHAQGESSRRLVQSTSVQRLVRRASTGVFAARATTPNPRNHNYCVPERPASRITRASLPSLPEVRGKARHGGIYSLLLQNKSGTKEPVLVEDAHNPEEVVTAVAPSVYKLSPPRTFGKQKHGGN